MHGQQDGPQHLLLSHQVVQVGARVAPRAYRAGARRVKRAVVVGMAGVLEVEPALAREGRAHARRARGQHAVKHVDAAGHAAHERGGVAHAHEVARLVLGHVLGHKGGQRLEHHLVALPHRVAADAKAREVAARLQLRKRPQAKAKVHAALHDAKERLVRSGVRLPAALGPHAGQLDGPLHEGTRRGVAGALVKLHHDVGAQQLGDAHVLLGRPEHVAAVVVHGAELDALVGQLHVVAVAEHLEAARVGKDGPIPAHERMESAHLGHQLGPRPHGQVVGVGQQNLGAKVMERVGKQALYGCLRAHRHEDGRGHVAVGGVQHAGARVRGLILGHDVIGKPRAAVRRRGTVVLVVKLLVRRSVHASSSSRRPSSPAVLA